MDIKSYQNAIDFIDQFLLPSTRFKTSDEVREFLREANDAELQGFMRACEQDEAYEYAQIAKKIYETRKITPGSNDGNNVC